MPSQIPNNVTVVLVTVKPVLSSHYLRMAYWPLNTDWLFNTGLTNVRLIIENEGSQRANNIYIPQQIESDFYLFLPLLGRKEKS